MTRQWGYIFTNINEHITRDFMSVDFCFNRGRIKKVCNADTSAHANSHSFSLATRAHVL